MSNSHPFGTFQVPLAAKAAMDRYLRVDLDSDGEVVLAGAADSIGVLARKVENVGDTASVNLHSSPSGRYKATSTVDAGNKVYGAANGEVDENPASSNYIGRALNSVAAGGIVDVLHV